ncbi:transcriptional regulator [Sporosarcina sp. FSL K6-3508]|uniref:transcriptional regulator n=1 Tax=Sporosarcina sp. FSL K6-3508 TaxID=2921557 RepID=UPI00315A21AF
MRKTLERAVSFGEVLEMMYLAKDGSISKRKIKVLQVGDNSFRAYCFLRKSKRTFLIENVLAAVPITQRESAVI